MAKFHCDSMDIKLNPLIKLSGSLDLVDYNSEISARLNFSTIPSPDNNDQINRDLVNG